MSLPQFPDWRHVGWHIGKKLKDIIGSSPPGPSKEEKSERRLQDALKGLSYFDDFDEVEKWQSQDVNTYQRANTPLIQRPKCGLHAQKPKLILCHDYKGAYHDYEGVRPFPVSSPPYRCEYLQYVDTFIYFSHKLVCIPPPTWTNALHRSGVKVLGTFLIEPQNTNVDRLFTKLDGKYRIAEQLARMAFCYGFDGWLLNVEKEYSTNVTFQMLGFIAALKTALGAGHQVIWYDALTVGNELKYQNGLTSKNLKFAQVAGALFANYKWTESSLHRSKEVARQSGIGTSNVFFGIDTWAQNTNMTYVLETLLTLPTLQPGPRRVTFPSEGGGGTNSGLAASILSQHGFSTALFAPAWTYEHFSTATPSSEELPIAVAVDRSMWEGIMLPDELGCDCRRGKPHHTEFYRSNPIIKQIDEFPTGSNQFFETHFSKGYEEISSPGDERKLLPTIGWQDPKPTLSSGPDAQHENDKRENRTLYSELGTCESAAPDAGGNSCLKIYSKLIKAPVSTDCTTKTLYEEQALYRKPLYMLSMDPMVWLIKAFHSRTRAGRSVEVGIYVAYRKTPIEDEVEYEYHEITYAGQVKAAFTTSSFVSHKGHDRLSELGVYCRGAFDTPGLLPLIELRMLSIIPEAAKPDTSSFVVLDLKVVECGKAPYTQQRFTWTWQGSRVGWPDMVPWSDTTGPFSYFEITVNGKWLGRAYATEFPLAGDEVGDSHRDREGRLIGSVQGRFFGSFPSSQSQIASLEI